jgi:ubiquinone biosynthesis protein COQ4
MKYTQKDFHGLNHRTPSKVFLPFRKMQRTYSSFRFFLGCLAVIRDPKKTDAVLRTAQSMITPERFAGTLEHLKNLPGGTKMFADKRLLPSLNVSVLCKYPADTLGYAYAKHMLQNNLDPDFYDVEFSDEITYAFYRYGKLHDLLHILTGYDTTIAGEMGVLGYSYAQNRGPGLILAASLAFLHGVLFSPQDLYSYIKNFIDGWRVGDTTKAFFTLDWDRALQTPLCELHLELGFIKPRSSYGEKVGPTEAPKFA